VGRSTLDRWARAYRSGGFDALVPAPRSRAPRTAAAALELAVALKTEAPARTAMSVAAILAESGQGDVSARTLQRHFARLGLNTRPDGAPPKDYGRFEAKERNDLWDRRRHARPDGHGQKRPISWAFIDDHSRLLPGYLWTFPRTPYIWNRRCAQGSALVACPGRCSSITAVHLSAPRSCGRAPSLVPAWSTQNLGRQLRKARSKGCSAPSGASSSSRPRPEASRAWPSLNHAFLCMGRSNLSPARALRDPRDALGAFYGARAPGAAVTRTTARSLLVVRDETVTKTATVSLHGNSFEVDAALVGRRAELVFQTRSTSPT